MQRRSLSTQVSASEMRTMRESGMTNKEIAESLDCHVNTVIRYIGANPNRRRQSSVATNERSFGVPGPERIITPPPLPQQNPGFATQSRFSIVASGSLEFTTEDGSLFVVRIHGGKESLEIACDDLSGSVPLQRLDELIDALTCIKARAASWRKALIG